MLTHAEYHAGSLPLPPCARYVLTGSGLAAACYAQCTVERVAFAGRMLYLGLDLGQLPAAVRHSYVAVGVEVEAEGHGTVRCEDVSLG